jgi:hypothetical protein
MSQDPTKKELYLIDRPEESKEYMHAWMVTGKQLQSLFNQYNRSIEDPHTGYCWLRTEVISPTFDSMNFRYKNRTFSILIDLISKELRPNIDAQKKQHHGYGAYMKTALISHTPKKARELQINICEANDMIPCIFPIQIDDMTPLSTGWNLYDTRTDEKIIPMEIADDTPRPISEWELHNFGISIVRNYLRDQGHHLLSFTDAPGITPHIWFEDDNGNKNWVQVIVNRPAEITDLSSTIAKEYQGYIAGVSILPIDGQHVLYRSNPANISFKGLQAIT